MKGILKSIDQYHIILASKSPRRQELLRGMGLEFEIRVRDTEEGFDPAMPQEEIAPYLAGKKAAAFDADLKPGELLITADTIVCIGDVVLNKPQSKEEAHAMLRELSGQMHRVYTGVCLTTTEKQRRFCDETKVFFRDLADEEIAYYVENYRPFDKAGSYGAQEWMGYVGVERIEGSYFNVMGLPVHKLYTELMAL